MMLDVTPRGYTGHEHLDVHGVIHMNGRIYDPHLARFLQADPFVEDTGTLNRYTYVHNNPLIYTDPSGHFSVKKWGKIALSIAITVYSGGSAAGASWGLWGTGAQVTAFQAGATVAVGGALSGAVASGTWEGAFYGAFTGLAFHNIGQTLGASTWAQGDFLGDYSAAGLAAKTVSHGITGGAITHMQGGRFGHGFLSSGVTAASSPYIATKFDGNRYAQGATAAIVGGTVSSATGGKFANGAVTAAMAYAFNQIPSSQRQESGTSYAERAEIYGDMQAQLEETGIDTVWFGAAADLNEFFASRPFMPSFMNDLGEYLLDHNRAMFQQVMSGALSVDGQALDNLLVQREQMLVQSFLRDGFGSSVPAHVRGPVNLNFRIGRRTMPIRVQRGIGSVEDTFDQRFNFWDTAHRIHLGEAIMSQRRHGM